ncbi:unnamed protein product [Caenorhabditis angaria]|uniref:Uncharacterized protein n=1 Tax=Caenorhabditis angaria TaxID=860376 RepID=A0A9P1IDZ8_9PELO|nr:unnamed protein product [Caenorhabditis angaria]
MICFIIFFTSIIFRIALVSAESESEKFNAILSDPDETKRLFGDISNDAFLDWNNDIPQSLDDGKIVLHSFLGFTYTYENVNWQDINSTSRRIILDSTRICMAFNVISFMISSTILSFYLLLATIFVQIMHYLQMLTYIPGKQFLPFNIKLYHVYNKHLIDFSMDFADNIKINTLYSKYSQLFD